MLPSPIPAQCSAPNDMNIARIMGQGNYRFSYNEKHLTGGSFRSEQGNALGGVTGSYGLIDADGRRRIVDYVADAHGFRASVKTNEPGTLPNTPTSVAAAAAVAATTITETINSKLTTATHGVPVGPGPVSQYTASVPPHVMSGSHAGYVGVPITTGYLHHQQQQQHPHHHHPRSPPSSSSSSYTSHTAPPAYVYGRSAYPGFDGQLYTTAPPLSSYPASSSLSSSSLSQLPPYSSFSHHISSPLGFGSAGHRVAGGVVAPIVAGPAGSPIVAGPAGSPIVAGPAGSSIVAGPAGSPIVAGPAGSSLSYSSRVAHTVPVPQPGSYSPQLAHTGASEVGYTSSVVGAGAGPTGLLPNSFALPYPHPSSAVAYDAAHGGVSPAAGAIYAASHGQLNGPANVPAYSTQVITHAAAGAAGPGRYARPY